MMAPPKTMTLGQQQSTLVTQSEQTVKPRRRRGKNQQQQQPNSQQSIQQQQVTNSNITTSLKNDKPVVEQAALAQDRQQAASNLPNNCVTTKQQQTNPVPSSVKAPLVAKSKKPTGQASAAQILNKQISTEDTDEIDAGIELDGSSNSGSSVKDLCEDPSKSSSVSPVMAQSNLVNENRSAQHAIEVAPMEQLAGSLCSEVAPTSKKISSTKAQLLAANQQVMDADEQQIQEKTQSSQRKLSLRINNGTGNTVNGANSGPQSPALCKVCEQHVYQMERMLAEKSVYHKKCFRCFKCKIQLRVDNYSSHEGQVYCKAHHREIFQPQVKLDNDNDVDIVAKSKFDDYLQHRGRLSELSFSFLQPSPEGIQKRQMIICENQPVELPKDVVKCDTKLDDGIDRLNLNLNNILKKFEHGGIDADEVAQPSSPSVLVDKTSFNIKKTLMDFETKLAKGDDDDSKERIKSERPIVRKLKNVNQFLNRQGSSESDSSTPIKPVAIKRSESLMMRLKKYESRIAGERVADDDSDDDDENNNKNDENSEQPNEVATARATKSPRGSYVPKRLTSIDLSSLKNQWENGDISKKRFDADEGSEVVENSAGDMNCNGNSPLAEKNQELFRIRQGLAEKRPGSIKNIYENAIKEAQQAQQTAKLSSGDIQALSGLSTTQIQKQLLQNGTSSSQNASTPSTPNKDHFQLNLSNKANKLKERFEQGLITNGSQDDSGQSDDGESVAMTKLEQIRQEKLEDLSIFTEGEIKVREARDMFQQIDRRLSAANGKQVPNSKSLASISASMRNKLIDHMNSTNCNSGASSNNASPKNSSNNNLHSQNHQQSNDQAEMKPIRLTNNVKS